MALFDTLPVVLVSAANEAAAAALISELIDDDITDEYDVEHQCADRVWRLVNKYYTAKIRVHPLTDDRQLDVDPDNIDAHIIYITEEEAPRCCSVAAARVAGGGGAWRRSAVRLLLLGGAREPGAARAWAAEQRAHAVALRGAPDTDDDHDEDGWSRARAALHAHVWRGLTRTDCRAAAPPPADRYGGSCSGSESEGSEPDGAEGSERRAVEQAEAFAAALEELGGALESRHAPERAARLRRAESVVRAFCRALALPLDE